MRPLLALSLTACSTVEAASPRPNSADADACTLPELGADLVPAVLADDIPVAFTPVSDEGCGYDTFPSPILDACTEPLPPGVPDLRGLWEAVEDLPGHVERIEQCGDRLIVIGGGVVHDMRCDGTLENGVNDVNAQACFPIEVAAAFVDGVHELRPFGGPVLVTRRLVGERLEWVYAGTTLSLERRCTLPEGAR